MTRRATRRRLILISFILLGAFLRLYQLGVDSLWYDETVSLLLAGKPIPAMITHTARDIHPPAYYLLLNLWRRIAGDSEFAAAWPSFAAGLLLIPAVYVFARRLLRGAKTLSGVPLLSAALVATSPFNIWYSQEIRMYTVGALISLIGGYAAWRMLEAQTRGDPIERTHWWWMFVIASALGLYTLYYYAFLLVALALIVLIILWRNRLALRPWAMAAGATMLLWLPWIPVAYRQAVEPPVPPWRSLTPFSEMMRESFAVLAFGQSVEVAEITLWLIAALIIYGAGIAWLWQQLRAHRLRHFVPLLLVGWTWGAILLIALFSRTLQPLYHPRYVFTYSPPFYIVLAAGSIGIARSIRQLVRDTTDAHLRFLPQLAVLVLLLTGWSGTTAVSLRNFWYDTDYAADDFRSAMQQLERRWYPGEALLVNAGYVYPTVTYYFDDPIIWQGRLTDYERPPSTNGMKGLVVLQTGSLEGSESLGWGRPDSDFYSTSPAETIDALETVGQQHTRLWMLRAYDTVTDPDGVIRSWLATNGTLFYDERLTGESNIRLQGWLMPAAFEQTPTQQLTAQFLEGGEPQIALQGYDRQSENPSGGESLDLTLYVDPLPALTGNLRVSLGLYDSDGRQWSVEDTYPLGPLTPLYVLQSSETVPVPIRLPIPVALPPDDYELRVKFYRPDSGKALQAAGATAANDEQVRLFAIPVRPTPADAPLPNMQRSFSETAGPLRLLAASIVTDELQVGQSTEVELLWQIRGQIPVDLQPRLVADDAIEDDGGLAAERPTSQWPAESLIRDVHTIHARPDAKPSNYTISLRLLEGARALDWGGLIRTQESIALVPLRIEDRPRSFTPPSVTTEVNAAFGEAIELFGYTFETTDPTAGGSVNLTVAWHARSRPAGRYKVFTHLVGPDGQIHGQRDLEPGRGTLPTNGWAREEYVTMQYDIPIDANAPAGTYELRVGLYDPNTGARVPVQHPQANVQDQYLSLAAVDVDE